MPSRTGSDATQHAATRQAVAAETRTATRSVLAPAPASTASHRAPPATDSTGASAAGPFDPHAGITILTFHGIGAARRPLTPGELSTWIPTATFEGVLDLCSDRSGARTDVAITFDDANESDLTIALPALLRRRLSATFFIPAAALGRDGWLDGAGVRTLVAAGMRIGSHGMYHKAWLGLDVASARVEMFEARDRLEDWVEGPVTDAACPFGAYDRRTLHRLRQAGYLHVYTSDRGRATPGAWIQPRNTIRPADRPADVLRLIGAHPGAARRAARALRLAWKRWR